MALLPFLDPNDPLGLKRLGAWPASGGGGGVATLAPPAAAPAPVYNPRTTATFKPTYNDPAYNAATNQFSAQQGALDARYAVLDAQRGVQPFTMATLNAQRGVLGARQGTFGAQQGVINAQRGVQGAQGVQLSGQRGLIGQQQQEVGLQRGEYNAELNAQNNTADQSAVAQFRRTQGVSDARNRALGIAPDQEIDAPVGFTGSLPPGVRVKATTQAEDVARTNKENQTQRGFDLDSAKLAVQLMGTDVDQARLVAAQAGLTLDEAQLGVAQAENAAGYAKLDESQAGIGVDNARLNSEYASLDSSQADLEARLASRPPFPGAEKYTDPYTGEQSWMTPSEADHLQYQYQTELGLSHIPTENALSQQRQIFNTQKDAEGSELAPISTSQLLNMYVDPSSFQAPWFTGDSKGKNNILSELTRRLVRQGYSQGQAESAAKQLIEYEMEQRRQQAANKAPTTPTLTVDANGKIVVKP